MKSRQQDPALLPEGSGLDVDIVEACGLVDEARARLAQMTSDLEAWEGRDAFQSHIDTWFDCVYEQTARRGVRTPNEIHAQPATLGEALTCLEPHCTCNRTATPWTFKSCRLAT